MKAAEKSLLLATRNLLQTAVGSGGAGYTTQQCCIAPTDEGWPTASDLFIIVGPLGWRPGPRHSSSGLIRDFIYSLGVFVARRQTVVPSDKQDQVFTTTITSNINLEIDKIIPVVDWSQTLRSAANALITAENGSTEGFITPLRFEGVDPKPRVLTGEFFGAQYEQLAGLGRLIRFGGARRITTLP